MRCTSASLEQWKGWIENQALLQVLRPAQENDEKMIVICITRRQCKASDTVPEIHCASTEGFDQRDPKMRLINVLFLRTISEIKLKRTDTTLDLSQKAKRAGEKEKEEEEVVEEANICTLATGATGR